MRVLWELVRSQALEAIPCIGDDLAEHFILHILGRLRDTAYGHMRCWGRGGCL